MTQQILDEANRALQQGRLDDAEKLLRGVVQADPQSLSAHVALATVLSRKEQHGDAADSYANAMRIDRGRSGLALHYAISCFRARRYDEAERSARFAVGAEPTSAGYDALACALREQGKIPEALTAAEEALRLSPGSAPALNTKGSVLLAAGRHAEALAIFEDLETHGVRAPAISINRGIALEKLGRTPEAQRVYAEATAIWPNFAEIQRERTQRRN